MRLATFAFSLLAATAITAAAQAHRTTQVAINRPIVIAGDCCTNPPVCPPSRPNCGSSTGSTGSSGSADPK